MPGSKHSVLGIIQVTIDKIIVSITGFTTIDHRGIRYTECINKRKLFINFTHCCVYEVCP